MPAGSPRSVALLVVGIVVFLLLWSSVKYVPAGHVGVLVMFGRVTDTILPEGTRLANPLAVNNVMSVRFQERKESARVLSKEALEVTLDTSLRFRLDKTKANEVYRDVGLNYVEVIIDPTLRSTIRTVTAAYPADALYTSVERQKVQTEIEERLRVELNRLGIIIDRVLLRDAKLPNTVTAAIEAKQQAEQDSLRMEFILTKEKQEAERKRIEAKGISDFQKIVAQGISRQLLTWKGIEATEKLAASPNSKVIVIGSGKDGLPLILGGAQ